MKEQIRKVVNHHCKKIKSDVNTDSIAKAVKSIDSIVQKMYYDLYSLDDKRYNITCIKTQDKKQNHCC